LRYKKNYSDLVHHALKNYPTKLVCSECVKPVVGFIGSWSKCCHGVILPISELVSAFNGKLPDIDDILFRKCMWRKNKRIQNYRKFKNIISTGAACNYSLQYIKCALKFQGFKLTAPCIKKAAILYFIYRGKK
jgi:hypothetical protein